MDNSDMAFLTKILIDGQRELLKKNYGRPGNTRRRKGPCGNGAFEG